MRHLLPPGLRRHQIRGLRRSSGGERIIITGTGRTGTTFLLQLFTALAFDTGFTLEQALQGVDDISLAGLERRPLVAADNPYVIKSPWYADELSDALEQRRVALRAAIIPVRDLGAAAESRRRVYREAAAQGLDPLNHPGSLWHTESGEWQEARLLEQFYKAVFPLVRFDVPIHLLHYPRLITDAAYLRRKLEPLLAAHRVTTAEFLDAHARVVRPEAVHALTAADRG